MGYDRLTCLMYMADRMGYGVHYGRLVAETTVYERDELERKGRAALERRDAARRAARGRREKKKGEGQWRSDPERRLAPAGRDLNKSLP